jgi:two-component system, NarL family, response regulator YdfI
MADDLVTLVLVAAPAAATRARLETLATTGSTCVVASTGLSRGAFRRRLAETRPDVVLMDTDATELRGVLRDLSGGRQLPATVVLTDDPRRAWGVARRAGLQAVLPRHATPVEVATAIQAAAAGLLVLHPDALGRVPRDQDAVTPALRGEATPALTAREMEVLGMLADGLGNKTLAARLGISEHTVKFHIAAIFLKLKAGSRTEAVTLGIRNGLILV